MHIPVLKKEVVKYLAPKKNQNFIDATIGELGHALEILKRIGPKGKVLGIDWDPEIIKKVKNKIQAKENENRLILVCDNFANLKKIVEEKKFQPINGVLFDLGLSSWDLENSGRGFSFQKNEPLIMKYNPDDKNYPTAKEIVNRWGEKEIKKILKEFSQEKFAKIIAKNIVKTRKIKPIETTKELVEVIKSSVPGWYQHKKIHCATKTFQALRIAANNELNNLKIGLSQAVAITEKNGHIVVISFHSLEDKIVKSFFKKLELAGIGKIITKKPIKPSIEEIKINRKSRSAKLRAIKIIK